MSKEKIHINDIGSDIILRFVTTNNVAFDISSATTKEIVFKTSDGTVKTKNAQFLTDGTDGKLIYTLISGDIDIVGIWKIWGKVNLATGQRTSDSDYFTVIN